MRGFLVCLAMLCLSGSALASGDVTIGPIRVVVDNGHTEACEYDASGLCPVGLSGSGGDTFLDANQDLRSIDLRVDGKAANDATGVELVPTRTANIDLSDGVRVANPIYPIFKLVEGEARAPEPLGDVGYSWYEGDYLRIFFLGPPLRPLGPGVEPRVLLVPYSGLGWAETWGADNELGNNTLDDFLGPPFACSFLPVEGCAATEDALWTTYVNTAPDIGYGLSYGRITLHTEG